MEYGQPVLSRLLPALGTLLVVAIGMAPVGHTALPRAALPGREQGTLPKAESQPFVRASGTRLFLGGLPFLFRGFNLYNINGRGNCGYAIPDLDAELDEIQPAANVVRGWFFQRLATDPSTGAYDWTAFDETLAALRDHNIKVIATLADEWGACDGDQPRGRLTLDWYRAGYRVAPYSAGAPRSYRDWVAAVVSRYRADPTILAWQLMNEAEAPLDASGTCAEAPAAAALHAWATDVSALIKQLDPHHLVSVGTIGGGQCGIRGPDYTALHAIPTVDLCEHHDYRPEQMLPDDLRYDLDVCNRLGKPTFVGELGVAASRLGNDINARASLLARKARAALDAGAAGVLVWAWRSEGDGGSSATSFDVGPDDPLLDHLARFPDTRRTWRGFSPLSQ